MGSTHPPVGVASILLAVAVLIAGCGGGDDGADRTSSSGGGETAATKAVTIRDYLYAPETITVPVGTTVTFTNRDSTQHTATSKQSGAFESGSLDTGESGEVKLEKTGSFAYYCLFHPFMKGTIVVE